MPLRSITVEAKDLKPGDWIYEMGYVDKVNVADNLVTVKYWAPSLQNGGFPYQRQLRSEFPHTEYLVHRMGPWGPGPF